MRVWVGVIAVVGALVVGKASYALDFDEVGSAIGLLGSIVEPVAEIMDADAVEAALDPSHFADPTDQVISESVAGLYAAEIAETTGSLRAEPEALHADDDALRGSLVSDD